MGDPEGLPFIGKHGTPGGRITYWEAPTIHARHCRPGVPIAAIGAANENRELNS
jgi:hypothetical protein